MKLQRKSRVAILLLMLAFNLTTTTLLVQALDPGVGKYLRIEFIGEGSVIATKEKTGETWSFEWDGEKEFKVGAGTVSLEAFPADGYVFVEWTGDLESTNNPEYFKTEKYAIVTAVFDVAHTITASAGDNGEIIPAGDVIVRHGYDQTFTFVPYEGYHVSTIKVEGVDETVYAESYTFLGVTEDHTIHVDFSEDGTVYVPEGPGTHFLDSVVSATVTSVTKDGVILGYSVIDEVAEGMAIRLYVIGVDPEDPPTTPDGVVFAFLVPDGIDPYELTIIKGDSIEAVCSDVNNDAQVDGTDVSIVANAIKFKKYYPWLDTNGDGELTEADIKIINENKGTILEDVTDEPFCDPSGRWFVTTLPMMDDDPIFNVK